MRSKETLLNLNGIWKHFGGISALEDIDFDLFCGEVHALVGENGAGKSTLVKIIQGVHQPDRGQILFKGNKIKSVNPRLALEHKIGVISQEPNLVPEMTVAENISLWNIAQKSPLKLVRSKEFIKSASMVLQKIMLNISPKAVISSLRFSDRQLVEIAKAIALGAEVIIMDEPTSALTKDEIDKLFGIVIDLKNSGVGIIYISHRMEEIFTLADRVTVLRDGRKIKTSDRSKEPLDEKQVIRMMVGRDIVVQPRQDRSCKKKVLEVIGLTKKNLYEDINLYVKEGEVVGLSGLVGAGRSDVGLSIFGYLKPDSGTIKLEGKEIAINTPGKAKRLGVGLIPEDRKQQGIVPGLSIFHNFVLTITDKLNSFGILNKSKAREIGNEYRSKLKIKMSSMAQPISQLSGGNQQKVVVSKWLATGTKVLILDEPTRGIDVQAKSEIHALIDELTGSGIAVLLISSELPEIIALSDRVYVMHKGKITGQFARENISAERIMACSIGAVSA